MKKKSINFLISIIFIFLALSFTFFVKMIDVQEIGLYKTRVGFATLNEFIFNKIGVNMKWYYITDWFGIIPILIAIVYATIGLIQLIKRKSLLKVDKELIVLGVFYIIVILIYLFFETYVVNYRPIPINGFMEASYPSSHTMITLCLCGSSIIINKKIFNNNLTKFINIFSFLIICITVIGRFISGVHWFTDILGGIIISMALLMFFYSILNED